MFSKVIDAVVPLLKGLALTIRHIVKPAITLRYPEEKHDVAPRWKGRHMLVYHTSGKIKCVACMLCKTVCPADCIEIEAAAEPDNRKYPAQYTIDLGRCIFCGLCQEVCPLPPTGDGGMVKEAIQMTTAYEISQYTREALILNKEQLLKPPEPRYEQPKKTDSKDAA